MGPGSIFMLAIAAVAKLKLRVRDVELTHEVVQRINHLMRDPHPCKPIIEIFAMHHRVLLQAIRWVKQLLKISYQLFLFLDNVTE
jgi:hypothetical protein